MSPARRALRAARVAAEVIAIMTAIIVVISGVILASYELGGYVGIAFGTLVFAFAVIFTLELLTGD